MSYRGEIQANTQITVKLGPFLDKTDGDTAETALAIAQADIRVSKNSGDFAQVNHNQGGGNLSHDELGYYDMTLDTTDTNTEGRLLVVVHESGALLCEVSFNVLAQAAYVSKYTAKDAGFIDVNVKTVGRADTQETEANNLEAACANYSATRGLTGTAVPAAAADAAGGIPISDAGGLDLDTILGRITGNVSTAAKLLKYIQLLARSDAAIETDNATELTEINADGGSGAGNYSAQTDSGEAIRDHVGDGTNLTEAGGDGDHLTEAGGTGDHLTARPWVAAWDAEVQSECADALTAYGAATTSDVTTVQNNATGEISVASIMEIPAAGSNVYRIEFFFKDTEGNMEAPDAAPTIGVVNQGGTSRDANLSDTTMSLVSAGRYRVTYTVSSAHAAESLDILVSVTEGSATRLYQRTVLAQDEIGNKIDTLYTRFLSTSAELAGAPAHNASIIDKIEFMFMNMKNENVADNSGETATISVANNAGSAIATANVTQTADTSTKGQYS